MAPLSRLPVALLLILVAGEAAAQLVHYDRVFSFGDSLTDTGNSAILQTKAGGLFTGASYGHTYFHRSSGRASDGRLIIDFIVESLGIGQSTPYLAGETAKDFRYGANFAVGGATALDPAFLNSRGIRTFVPVSLSNETTWFKNVLQLLDSSGCNEQNKITASTVFYFGEIGFNDYSSVLIYNGRIDMAKSLVPHIIGVIRSALTAVIAAGARTVVVTGMIPIGCEPELLALYPAGAGDYDRASGCIMRLNKLAEFHNRALTRMLRKLRRAHPGTDIHYADFYRPVTTLISSPKKYGFGNRPLAACCGGGGGPYNFNFTFFCGAPGSTTCAEPSKSISWDGIHYTEATNKFVAHAMLRDCKSLGATKIWKVLSGLYSKIFVFQKSMWSLV